MAESLPRVSVIIPTYRHRDFVLETLASVFEQTMSDYEVIVVNDGSPDDTADVLAPLVRSGRIAYFEQSNQGQSRARNFGIGRARGEYLAFLDDDDLWPADKLQWQVEYLDANPEVGLVGGTLQMIDERGAPGWRGRVRPTITFESLFLENPFLSPGQTLIRTALLQELGGMNASIWGADDWDLWFRIAKVREIVMLDRLALYYRIHPGNASKQTARLIAACRATADLHLRDVEESRRHILRSKFQRNVYSGLGSALTRSAGRRLRSGKVLGAMQSLKGLLPLWPGILFDRDTRSAFVEDLRDGWSGHAGVASTTH